jgi:thermopsin
VKSCLNCGMQASDEDRFCRACGRPFSVVVGAIPGPSTHNQTPLPFEETDEVAIQKFWLFGLISAVAFVVGLTSYLPLGLTFPATQLVQLVVFALELVGVYYLRLGFKALSRVDQPSFGSQVTFTTVYAVGLVVLAGFFEVYYFAVFPALRAPASPALFSPSGLAIFFGLGLAFFVSGIVGLVGLIGGVILGLWRVGSRYGRTWLKAASIMYIVPIANVFAGITFLLVFRALTHSLSRSAPPSVYSPPRPSHTLRNVSIVVAAVFLSIVVLGAAFYFIFSSTAAGPHLIVRAAPAPTGIADYGLTSDSGTLLASTVAARQITAQVTINDITASNPSVVPPSNSHLVTLQMNLLLRVNSTKGMQVYWVQNIAFLYTETGYLGPNSHYLNFNNEIDNFSARSSGLDNSTISGTAGWVFPGPPSHYASGSPNGNYFSFPLAFSFYTNESVVPGGVRIMMGFDISKGARDSGFYDTVFIKIANVTGAALVVDGRSLNPIGTYYDAELVFGGPPGGYSTTFASMNSTLALIYTLADGAVTRPHSVWEFGSDTGEVATNLQTNLVNGKLVVTVGKVDLSRNYQLG